MLAQGIATEFLAHREKIEVTRHDSTCELSPVCILPTFLEIDPSARQAEGLHSTKYCRYSLNLSRFDPNFGPLGEVMVRDLALYEAASQGEGGGAQ